MEARRAPRLRPPRRGRRRRAPERPRAARTRRASSSLKSNRSSSPRMTDWRRVAPARRKYLWSRSVAQPGYGASTGDLGEREGAALPWRDQEVLSPRGLQHRVETLSCGAGLELENGSVGHHAVHGESDAVEVVRRGIEDDEVDTCRRHVRMRA